MALGRRLEKQVDQRKKKVVVIGVDGATFDIISPMIKKGRLKNFARLLKESAHGTLVSTIPPNSSVAWSSFMTGKKPGKHGVYFFMEKKPNSYARPVISAKSIKAKTLWNLLSEQGKRVIVVNVPVTYPPEKVNGFLVGGLLTPSPMSVFTHPPELHMELIAALGDYPIDTDAVDVFLNTGDEVLAYQSMVHGTRKVHEAAKLLMSKNAWDFAMVMFSITDKVAHVAWKYTIPEYQKQFPEKCAKFRGLIETSYELVDDLIGDIISTLDEDTSVIIMSDHGFGPIHEKFYVNRWLRDEGLLVLKKGGSFRLSPLRALRNFLVGPLMRKILGERIVGMLSRIRARNLKFLKPARDATEAPPVIDWTRTRAYSSWTGGEEVIYLNVKGREPEGIVASGEEYERLRDEIIRKLQNLRDHDGERVVEKAYRREEIYAGPCMELAPDIQFVTRATAILPRGELFGKPIFEKPADFSPAIHRMNGIFFMRDRNAKKGAGIQDAHIEDMAPTIMHLLGLPVPEDMDGKVIAEAFQNDFLSDHPIIFKPVRVEEGDHVFAAESEPGDGTPAEEEADIRRRLKGLGYID
ncbi:MAG: hypothetical protein C4520_02460 [Candidatus Abyssobacteria bacterium SURF_5]|uniref:Nucleotide pyrophosphatase n=1 Tax=Abyssobacteria bacterium (strain SURF_5) TaxID=2093360 RepID=A0A3A4P3T8_ABYX5|nr:MAG: hypothetical protein C4520_02460 [Candidatus Abyssubacteria bacterium SURF_5]